MNGVLPGILAIVFFGLVFYAISKSGKLLAQYQGVFGWFSALVFFLFGFTAVLFPIVTIVDGIAAQMSFGSIIGSAVAGIIGSLLMLAICGWIYKNAKKQCPDFMKPKLLGAMLIVGAGIMFRWAMSIVLKFLHISLKPIGELPEATRVQEGAYLNSLNGEYGEFRVTSAHPTGKEGQLIDKNGNYHAFHVDSRGNIVLDGTGETLTQ